MFLLKDKKDKRVVYLGLEIKVTECEGNTVSMSSCKKYNNGGDHPSDFMEIDAIHFRCVDSKAGTLSNVLAKENTAMVINVLSSGTATNGTVKYRKALLSPPLY